MGNNQDFDYLSKYMRKSECPNPFPSELKILESITQKYSKLGLFDIRSVGEAGYVLESSQTSQNHEYNWCLFDYDDTLVGTTEVKKERDRLFQEYLSSLGIFIDEQQVKYIMKTTDLFSRWKERRSTKDIYHGNVHMAALAWSVRLLERDIREKSVEEIIQNMEETLDRIKRQIHGEDNFCSKDPFSIRDTDTFVLNGMSHMWPKQIADIALMKTMISPPHFQETIDAARFISEHRDSHKVNLGVFTFGDPKYQLPKVLRLMSEYENFAISQIWLTRIPKGEFLSQVREQYSTPRFLVVDDSPKELDIIGREHLKTPDHVHFLPVRSIRERSKECCNPWEKSGGHLVLDFRNPVSGRDVAESIIQKLNF